LARSGLKSSLSLVKQEQSGNSWVWLVACVFEAGFWPASVLRCVFPQASDNLCCYVWLFYSARLFPHKVKLLH